MSARVVKILVAIEATLLLGMALFSGGAALGLALPRLNPSAGETLSDWLTAPLPTEWIQEAPASSSPDTPESRSTLFRPFWQAWDIVHDEFVDQPVDDSLMMQGAIRGMLEALGDEHSGYMDQNEYDQANISLEGSYEGIGAWVDTDGEYLTIISAMAGSPAEAAGLEPGDQVIAVDGEDMTGIPPQLVVRRVMGPEGTTVLLTIRREDVVDPFDVQVTRGKINVPSVESETLDEGIAYVSLSSFGDSTVADLRRALEDRLAEEPAGLILDLRGNGGGYLASAVDVASEFIDEGVILTERFGDSHEEVYRADGGGLAVEIPLVVLINGGSASASEIVAGAVQDHGRGWIVGEPSFGKGSVQNWHPLDDESGAVRVTIARWYTPDGRSIEEDGLLPDIEVAISEDDVAAGRDPQLQRAIELLLGQTSSIPALTATFPIPAAPAD
jgi:carboxyl-terminal processing protease